MADLVPIPGCSATIRRGHYASIAALFAELQSLTGIVPQVLDTAETIAAGITPQVSGGSRPLSECLAVGSSAASDHFEDNSFGRSAIDLNNHRDFRAALGDTGFTTVMNKHGWFNMDISGNDFAREPWHWATHFPEDTTTTAGTGASPFSTVQEEDEFMIYKSTTASADGVIPAGWSFIQGSDGPLRPLSKAESDAYDFWTSHGIPARVATWSGDDIRKITVGAGLREWSSFVGLNPLLTGRIIYADPKVAGFPKVSV